MPPVRMVVLVELTEPEFAAWKKASIADYAADKVKAGNDTDDGALERSKNEFDSLLPGGSKTKDHHFFSVVDEKTKQPVGVVWYGDPPGRRKDMVWIYDIRINEALRGRGYGTATLGLIEEQAKRLGKARIGLHVFAHNQGARELYERLGYRETNINMAKDL